MAVHTFFTIQSDKGWKRGGIKEYMIKVGRSED